MLQAESGEGLAREEGREITPGFNNKKIFSNLNQ